MHGQQNINLCIFISQPKYLPIKWQQYTESFKRLQEKLPLQYFPNNFLFLLNNFFFQMQYENSIVAHLNVGLSGSSQSV